MAQFGLMKWVIYKDANMIGSPPMLAINRTMHMVTAGKTLLKQIAPVMPQS